MTWEGLNPPYATIVADPPWPYEEFVKSANKGRVAHAMPYSGLSVDGICALGVGELAAPDCRLFLWTTNRFLPDSFAVLDAWGFAYRQTLVWFKTGCPSPWGGSVAPNHAEMLLVAVRGKPPRLDFWPSSVVPADTTGVHSVKPLVFGDLMERVSPGPYVELFARAPRLGWDHWGHGFET